MSTARVWRENPQRYRMEAAKCRQCGKIWFPPRLICAGCQGREFETVRLAETGQVETYTVIRVAPTGFDEETPYAVAIVKLDDGVRITCQVADCEPEEMKIGLKVRMEFRRVQADGKGGVLQYGYKAVPV